MSFFAGKNSQVDFFPFFFHCFSPFKMWVLESSGKVVVAGPFKSEAEMAKKLGVSQQYVNRQLKKYNFLFYLDGEKIIARREKAYIAGKQTFYTKEDMALILGVSQEVIDKVFKKKTSGVIQTPKGKVKIAKLKPGETPIPLQPKVRPAICVWDDKNEKQEFSSFAAAAKELKIDSKTIPNALKAGKDSFTRKSDGRKFTIAISEETSLPKKVEEKEPLKVEKKEPPKVEEKFPPKKVEETPAAEDKQEKVTLGMDLWEKKTDEDEPEDEDEDEDPFVDREFENYCPTLINNYDNLFKEQKRNLLKPGEKVERYLEEEKDRRVLIVYWNFTEILEEYESQSFEDDFYLSCCSGQNNEEYYRKNSNLGMLPIPTGELFIPPNQAYVWRIKITPPKENQPPHGVEMNPLLFLMGLIFAFLS